LPYDYCVLQTKDAANHRSVELLTVRDAAEILKLTVHTVRRLVASGEIPASRIGGSIRVDRAEMLDALARRPVRVEEDESP
jgi:excisionase family DNA binding protein